MDSLNRLTLILAILNFVLTIMMLARDLFNITLQPPDPNVIKGRFGKILSNPRFQRGILVLLNITLVFLLINQYNLRRVNSQLKEDLENSRVAQTLQANSLENIQATSLAQEGELASRNATSTAIAENLIEANATIAAFLTPIQSATATFTPTSTSTPTPLPCTEPCVVEISDNEITYCSINAAAPAGVRVIARWLANGRRGFYVAAQNSMGINSVRFSGSNTPVDGLTLPLPYPEPDGKCGYDWNTWSDQNSVDPPIGSRVTVEFLSPQGRAVVTVKLTVASDAINLDSFDYQP